MSALRVRLIQPTLVDGDSQGNLAKALLAIAASAGEADLVVFPETHICGFPTPENVARLAERLGGPIDLGHSRRGTARRRKCGHRFRRRRTGDTISIARY